MIFSLNTTHKKCRQQKCNVAVHGLKLESRNWGEMKLFICACPACPVAPANGTGVSQDDRTGMNLRLNSYFFFALINKTADKERGIIFASSHTGNI